MSNTTQQSPSAYNMNCDADVPKYEGTVQKFIDINKTGKDVHDNLNKVLNTYTELLELITQKNNQLQQLQQSQQPQQPQPQQPQPQPPRPQPARPQPPRPQNAFMERTAWREQTKNSNCLSLCCPKTRA